MRRPSRTGLSWMFVCCANLALTAQDLHSIGREKPLSFSGGISVNQLWYASRGSVARRAPYSYVASGNVSLSLYGWSVPLSFSVSDRNTVFSQPFNQYALHPRWKWITAHAGYIAMSYSPYTVNGHLFRGAGVELSPEGKWRFSAFGGRLLKPVEAVGAVTPVFQRNGYGAKAAFGTGADYLEVVFFRARDDANSILPPPDSLGVAPQENTVLGIGGGKTLLRHLVIRGEMAASALTRDVRASKMTHDHPLARGGLLFQPRTSSAYYEAIKMSVDYQREDYTLGIGYERIDPEYRTLGAYYFNNDLENITLNTSLSFLERKLTLTASGGAQRDNVANTKLSSMRRLVGSATVNYTPSERLMLSATWSGFQTYTQLRDRFETLNELTPYDHPDTLRFTQISRNASMTAGWTLRSTERRRVQLSINGNLQDAADRQRDTPEYGGSRFYNLSAGYSLLLIPERTNLSLTLNASINDSPHLETRMVGPQASVQRTFFNRQLRTALSCSWNTVYSDRTSVNRLINARLNGVLALRQRHHIQLSTVLVRRIRPGEQKSASMEFTASLGYHYNLK